MAERNISDKDRTFNRNLADKNCKINKMPLEKLKAVLKFNDLDTLGCADVLRKRLKVYTQKHMNSEDTGKPMELPKSLYSYFLIIDFEATCEEQNPPDYQHEIIEFPIVLYDVVLKRTIDTFHSYCRPVINTQLSQFCCSLTNIDQETVDKALMFSEVLRQVEDWMRKHRLHESRFAIVSDCNADMAKFMRIQCELSGLSVPEWARHWINIHKVFRNFYQISMDQKLNLQQMLICLELQFEGKHHSGLDDAKNILRIAETLLRDSCDLRINERLDDSAGGHNYTASITRQDAELLGCRGDMSSASIASPWQSGL